MHIAPSQEDRSVDIVCSCYYGLTSLRPIVSSLKKKKIGFTVYINRKKMDLAVTANFLNVSPDHVKSEFYQSQTLRSILNFLDDVYRTLFTSTHFSAMYDRQLKSKQGQRTILRALKALSKFLPKFSSPNHPYHYFFGKLVPAKFTQRPVLAITTVHEPYWFCHKNSKVFLLVDSWDHPCKAPFFLKPIKSYAWNKDLAKDVKDLQKMKEVETIFPFRFDYIYALKDKSDLFIQETRLSKHLEQLPNNLLIYSVASASHTSQLFKGELIFIKELARYAKEKGLKLYVKARPENSPLSFKELEDNDAVIIGHTHQEHHQRSKHLPDLILDRDYNIYRCLLLKKCGLLINIGTSFVFEAAIMECPILQIDLSSDDPSLKDFVKWTDNPHLKRYLKSSPHCFKYKQGDNYFQLKSKLDEYLADKRQAMQFSKRLCEWLGASGDIDEHADRFADQIIANFKQ